MRNYQLIKQFTVIKLLLNSAFVFFFLHYLQPIVTFLCNNASKIQMYFTKKSLQQLKLVPPKPCIIRTH